VMWTCWRAAARRALSLPASVATALCCAIAVGDAPAIGAQELIDRVLAVAGGAVITLSDVRTARELGRVDVEYSPDPVREALSRLIDRALILEEVDRFAPPEPQASAIDASFAAVAARFGSPADFDALLARLGVDQPYVRELLREDLRIRAYLDQRFTTGSPEEQVRMVDEWVAGLRRRSDVEDLYETVSRPTSGTGAPGRD
jgi:hypothetical protein